MNEQPVRVYAHYGNIVVFDPSRELEVPSFDFGDLDAWVEAQPLLGWAEAQGEVSIRVLDEADDLDVPARVASSAAYIRVEGTCVRIGSIEAMSEDIDAFDVGVSPGIYLVHVLEQENANYVVKLLRCFGVPSRVPAPLLPLGLPRRLALAEVPVLKQLSMSGAELTVLLTQMTTPVRAGAALGPGSWRVVDGTLVPLTEPGWRPGHTVLTTLVDTPMSRFQEERVAHFLPSGGSGHTLYVWAGERRMVGARYLVEGGQLLDVELCLPNGLTPGDTAEIGSIAHAAFAASPATLPLGEAVPREPQIRQEWTSDCLTIHLGPLPSLEVPRLSVVLEQADGTALPAYEVGPVRVRDDFAVYELWLVGPREGARAATATVA